MLGNFRLQLGPIPEIRRGYAPQVVLKVTTASRATLVSLVWTVSGGHLHAGFDCCVVDGLEDLLVKLLGVWSIEGQAKDHEGVGETLNTDTNGTVAHVGLASLGNGVVVDVNDSVQVEGDDLGDGVELLEVVLLVGGDEGWESDGGEVADGDLIGGRVFDDLGAKIRRLDGTEVLLVGLA